MSHRFLRCLRHHLVTVVSGCFLILPLACYVFHIYVSAPLYSVRDHQLPHQLTVLVAQPEMPNNHLIGSVPYPQCSHDEGIEEHAVPQLVIIIRQGGVLLLLLLPSGLECGVSIFEWCCDIYNCHRLIRLIHCHKVRSKSSIHSRYPLINSDLCGSWSIQRLYQPPCMALCRLVIDVKLGFQCHRT